MEFPTFPRAPPLRTARSAFWRPPTIRPVRRVRFPARFRSCAIPASIRARPRTSARRSRRPSIKACWVSIRSIPIGIFTIRTTLPIKMALSSFPAARRSISAASLVGGFGVSGDGVDQDDVVTFYGAQGFQAPNALARRPILRAKRATAVSKLLPQSDWHRHLGPFRSHGRCSFQRSTFSRGDGPGRGAFGVACPAPLADEAQRREQSAANLSAVQATTRRAAPRTSHRMPNRPTRRVTSVTTSVEGPPSRASHDFVDEGTWGWDYSGGLFNRRRLAELVARRACSRRHRFVSNRRTPAGAASLGLVLDSHRTLRPPAGVRNNNLAASNPRWRSRFQAPKPCTVSGSAACSPCGVSIRVIPMTLDAIGSGAASWMIVLRSRWDRDTRDMSEFQGSRPRHCPMCPRRSMGPARRRSLVHAGGRSSNDSLAWQCRHVLNRCAA